LTNGVLSSGCCGLDRDCSWISSTTETDRSDFPTSFLGPNIGPSPNVKKAFFFPISRGKILNSVVIKLFVKIINESFFK
jgi:hypothetical protein